MTSRSDARRATAIAEHDRDDVPLSVRLRTETSEAHARAEQSTFLADLMHGRLGLVAWQLLLEQLGAVYGALETTAGRIRENDPSNALLSVELNRAEAIRDDLAALRGRTGFAGVGLLPSARDYAERILSHERRIPRYLAHHYTRYLGDLSGGQAIRVHLDRQYGLPREQAAFFRFEGIRRAPVFKDAYRSALDALPLSPADADAAVEEAGIAFDCNLELFDECGQVFASLAPRIRASGAADAGGGPLSSAVARVRAAA